MVVLYGYLWADEHQRGQREANKDKERRPCVILSVKKFPINKILRVGLAPLTHTAPMHESQSVRVPAQTIRRLGLDDSEPSWIACTEMNFLNWPSPFVLSAQNSTFELGLLPEEMAGKIMIALKENHASFRPVSRDEI